MLRACAIIFLMSFEWLPFRTTMRPLPLRVRYASSSTSIPHSWANSSNFGHISFRSEISSADNSGRCRSERKRPSQHTSCYSPCSRAASLRWPQCYGDQHKDSHRTPSVAHALATVAFHYSGRPERLIGSKKVSVTVSMLGLHQWAVDSVVGMASETVNR